LEILEQNKTIAKATFMDPRFKKAGFGIVENSNNAEKWITDELKCIIKNTHDIIESTTPPINIEPTLLWEQFDSKVSKIETNLSADISASLMLCQYLEIPYLSRTKCPLEF